MARLLLLVMLMALMGGMHPLRAQSDDSTVILAPDTPIVLRLNGDGRAVEAVFEAQSGQIVTVAARADDPDSLDLVLDWLTPAGERMAYSDDWAGGLDWPMPDGLTLAPSDPALIHFILPETGPYRVRVNTFNGEGVGDFELVVRIEDVPALQIGQDRPVWLRQASPRVFVLALQAGQSVTLGARDPRGRLDPYLQIDGPDGAMLGFNDDHQDTAFDARLSFRAPAEGVYRVRLGDVLGRMGDLRLTVGP